MWQSSAAIPMCPSHPRLDGKLMFVTGGNAGIGLETSKGLAQRGAEVVILARNALKAERAIEIIREESGMDAHFIPMDLANLESVCTAVDRIHKQWADRPIDGVIANAGIWPTQYSRSAQGLEMAFAVNVLGHHILIRKLISGSKLAKGARIVMLTGDIYIH